MNKAESALNARSYKFTGPDDIQYRWALGRMGMRCPKVCLFFAVLAPSTLKRSMKLVTTDGKETVIAEFHRAHHVRREQKARLRIQPVGMYILDYIILTFVFVENKRRQREARATWDIAGII